MKTIGIASMFLLAVMPALGQEGSWEGKLALPGDQPAHIKVVVRDDGRAELILSKETRYELSDFRLRGDTMTFSWEPGDERVPCKLEKRANGNFGGTCTVPGEDPAEITIARMKGSGGSAGKGKGKGNGKGNGKGGEKEDDKDATAKAAAEDNNEDKDAKEKDEEGKDKGKGKGKKKDDDD